MAREIMSPVGEPDAIRRPSRSRLPLWTALSIPGAWLLLRWAGGLSTYGDVVSRSGIWASLFLIPATAVTPLRAIFSDRAWLMWLAARRGDMGAAAILYSAAHALVYLIGRHDLGVVLREAGQGWLLAGWAALLLFVVFAAASDEAAAQRLRHVLRQLTHRPGADMVLGAAHRLLGRVHRIVYVGAALVVVHWALSAFDPLTEQVQAALRSYGYDVGPIDGIVGPKSRAALQAFQHRYGLPVTGTITPQVLDVLGIVPN
jgi:sulfoxide reductase heme-binding subunit YedZ